MTPFDSQGLDLARHLFTFLDSDTLCLMAADAIQQDCAKTPTEGLVYARTQIEQALARVLDRAHARALKRFAEEEPECEVITHITAARVEQDRHVLTEVGRALREGL